MMDGGLPGHIRRTAIEPRKEPASALPDPRTRGDLGEIALIFAELAGCYLAWEKGLEGWEMTESQVVNRWIERGELARTRSLLVRLLQRRFPGSVPPDVVETINAQPSLPLLETWFDAATTSPSVEEFIAVLRR